MKFRDHVTMCWQLVLRNRRRYKAVLAAIAFGTAGFIIVRTMGDSVERRVAENLELLGEATVMRAHWDNNDNYHPGKYYMRDVAKLRRIPNVMAVAPVVSLSQVEAYVHSNQWMPGLFGVDHSYWRTQSATLDSGRLIGPSDVVGRKTVCVLGRDVVKYLFDSKDPVGHAVKVGSASFEVVGVLGGIQHTEVGRSVFVPITTAQSLFEGLDWIPEIYVRADDWNTVEAVQSQVVDVLQGSHRGYEKGVRVEHYPERIKKVTTSILLVKFFIYAALGVAFLLGKVGLTSVMLAAVQDRTREIGLRKALGAREEIVMLQFLTESVFISGLAGVIGVGIGLISVELLRGYLDVEVSLYVMSSSILLDLAVTVAIGIIAGLYPSIQASRLDVVTAMRFE
ncbi:MAG: ABC transporter permease [Desulfomonile tiedjei]|nr:ABC transporter permease [Desulfomonile tiedjei]